MVALTPCSSSMVAAHGYDAASHTLAVQYAKSPKVYHYKGVPPEVAENLGKAKSLGQFLNTHVHGEYEHEAIDAIEPATTGEA